MSQIKDYKEYLKYKPNYAQFKHERNLNMDKKLEYLKNNPISKEEFNKNIERAKIVLNAVNIMDEYSQSKAEHMEQVTEATITAANAPIMYGALAIGGLLTMLFKGGKDAINEIAHGNFKNIAKVIPGAAAIIAIMSAFSIYTASWAAKKEVQASRAGRQESMEKDLASVNQFALLTPEQEKEVQNIAQSIKVDKKDSKKIIDAKLGLGIVDSIKSLFKKDNSEKYKANIKLNTSKLSKEEILKAKQDKDLIQNIVEKIDIASQDYAENAELSVGILTTLGAAGGGITGILAGLLLKAIKPLAKYSKHVAVGMTLAVGFASIVLGTKIQKQASRVGRFKAKNELLNNPEQLIYVDENKYKNTEVQPAKKEKKNYFKNLAQLWKDNLEYNKYIKENNADNIKKRKALEKINLSDEQKAEAKNFQTNIFNMFNKLDEKSQSYSESAECIGSSISSAISYLFMLPGMLLSMVSITKGKTQKDKLIGALGYFGSLAIPIVSNILITKDQKNASRVANMQAIKELDDYRYFAHQTNLKNDSSSSNQSPFDIFLKKNKTT